MSTPFDSWNSLCATTSEYYHTNCYARSPNALIAVEHLVKTQRIIKLPCLQLHNDCFHTLFMRPSGATVPILAIWFANCQSTRDTFTALHFEMIIANCQSTFARFFIVLCIMNRSSCLCYALQRFFYKGGERMRWIFLCILEPFLPVLCTAALFYKGGERMRWIILCVLEPFLPVLCTAAFSYKRGERMRWIFLCILKSFMPVTCTAALFNKRREEMRWIILPFWNHSCPWLVLQLFLTKEERRWGR